MSVCRFNARIRFRQTLLFLVVQSTLFAQSAALLHAQATADDTPPSFEAVSIKPDNSGSAGMHWTPGLALHISMTNITLNALIERAFGMSDLQVFGEPKWLGTKRYDIEADIDEQLFRKLRELPSDQQIHELQLMEQLLLVDRFNLKVTHQPRKLTFTKLLVAKNASKIRDFAGQSLPSNPTDGVAASIGDDGAGKMIGTRATMDNLAYALSRILGQIVENDTKMKGNYNFAISWTDDMQAGANARQDSSPSLQIALEDGLGLKLQSTKGPVDTINIDHIEEPSPN